MHRLHLLHVFRLAQQRQVFGHKLDRRIVPVVAMRMRYQHQLHAIQNLFDWKRQRHQRIGARLRRILNRRHGSRFAQHGVHQDLIPA